MIIIKKVIDFLKVLRMLLFHIYSIVVIGICSIVINIFAFFRLPLSWRFAVTYTWTYLYWIGMLIFLQVYIKFEGLENIDRKNSSIYVSKHQSMLETFIFSGIIKKTRFIIKSDLLKSPFFGKAMFNLGNIYIDRSQGISALKKVISEGNKTLNDGLNIVIFPEGTRVGVGEYPEFQRSAMKLATVANVKIIPVSHNFGLVAPRKWYHHVKPQVATMSFGESIDPSNFTLKELTSHCYEIINSKTREIGG